jgi:hypothetical protein
MTRTVNHAVTRSLRRDMTNVFNHALAPGPSANGRAGYSSSRCIPR